MVNPVGKAIGEELRKGGAPPPKKDPADYESDEMLFKAHVLDPQDPTYWEEQTWTNPADPNDPIKQLIRKGQLVSTMALGNFTSREVRGMNSLMRVARICARNGYHNIAAGLHETYVHYVIASQCIEFKLGTMLLTNLNALYRKEEFPTSREDDGDEGKSKGAGGILDKLKQLNASHKGNPEMQKMM